MPRDRLLLLLRRVVCVCVCVLSPLFSNDDIFSSFHTENNRTPVASMALLYWIQFVIRETSYIETYFRSHEVPVPLLLIEEVESLSCFPFFSCSYCHSFTAFAHCDNLVLILAPLSCGGREGRRHESALTLFSSRFGYSKPMTKIRRSWHTSLSSYYDNNEIN